MCTIWIIQINEWHIGMALRQLEIINVGWRQGYLKLPFYLFVRDVISFCCVVWKQNNSLVVIDYV